MVNFKIGNFLFFFKKKNESLLLWQRCGYHNAFVAKTFKVELCFAAKIPMAAIAQAIRGQESENSLEALRVLDIILRQHSAKQYVSSCMSYS